MGEILVETGDRWFLDFQDAIVDQCCFDYAVVLRSSQGPWELRLEQLFVISPDEGTEQVVVPAERRNLEFALPLLGTAINGAYAFKNGDLELKIGNVTLMVPRNDAFEAWTATGPDGLRVVSMPGGSLAIWSPSEHD